MPRLVADIHSGALAPRSALGYARIPGQIEWELLPVAGTIDSDRHFRYECLDQQNRAEETELALCSSVSFVRKRGSPIPRGKSKRALDQMARSNFRVRRRWVRFLHTALLPGHRVIGHRHNLGTFNHFGASAPEPNPQKTGAAHSSATISEAAAAFNLNGQSLG